MNQFLSALLTELDKNLYNYHLDNIDYDRFPQKRTTLRIYTSALLAQIGFFRKSLSLDPLSKWTAHLEGLDYVYNRMADAPSKRKLLEIVAYRILGHHKVKLSLNTPGYWEGLKQIKKLGRCVKEIPNIFRGESLRKFDLRSLGYDLTMFLHSQNVMATFFLQQYSYRGASDHVKVKDGDIVLDCGGCWGDTALYFANLVGKTGQVHVFEFVPGNLKILEENLDLNPDEKPVVRLVKHPVWSVSGVPVYVADKGPASSVFFEKREGTEVVNTIAIDDYLGSMSEKRIDFIKMDIEGAELDALKGAEQSIRTFRPSLAIAIYHRPEHLYQIAQWIDQLNLGYRFCLDHFTIHSEETMLFASARS